ncbi:hypothetical protein HMPREF0653_00417 [Prevotella disiens JCM 6334 = ATCC 29426]|uniref:Uncharacterized protein n=1 Tax=Prevotella disiens JCM 6334 = ATCC 29426 TaxID=1235811 RepID=A0ABP2YA34_9BACT|nr:hypothetical protein HMPREF0653_00417 [Prevotella disiens JCM 6334 = ATCC 29426]
MGFLFFIIPYFHSQYKCHEAVFAKLADIFQFDLAIFSYR